MLSTYTHPWETGNQNRLIQRNGVYTGINEGLHAEHTIMSISIPFLLSKRPTAGTTTEPPTDPGEQETAHASSPERGDRKRAVVRVV
jgi:hypothetical protein